MRAMLLLVFSLVLSVSAAAQVAPPETIHVSYQNISLSYDASLGTALSLETVPAVDPSQDLPWWGLLPQYMQIKLKDYPQNREYMPGQVMLFPVADYEAVGGDMVSGTVEQMQSLLAGSTALASAESLPYLPLANAHQVFHAQVTRLSFSGGDGIRYLTAFAQGPWPLSESEIFYTYQGMTADGQYYLSMQFPVRSNILPETPDASTVDPATFQSQLDQTVGQLDALAPGQFTPDLQTLDALVESILIGDAG